MMRAEWMAELRPALIAAGFLLMPARLFMIDVKPATLAAGFFAALAVYFADHALGRHLRRAWAGIAFFSGLFAGMLYVSDQLVLPGIFAYVILALLYVLPGLPGGRRLQDFPRLRVMAVVGGWTLMPLLLRGFPVSGTGLRYLVGIAGLVLAALLWSDRADAAADRLAGRHTWLMSLPHSRQRRLLILSLMLPLLCFSTPPFLTLLPAPLIGLAGRNWLERHPRHGDGLLLWPLFVSLMV